MTSYQPDEFDEYLAQSFGQNFIAFKKPIPAETSGGINELKDKKTKESSEHNHNLTCKGSEKMSLPSHGGGCVEEEMLDADFNHISGGNSDERLDVSARACAEESWDMCDLRPRASTMPSGVDRLNIRTPKLGLLKNIVEDLHRVRKFHLTRKGLVKDGDHYVSGKNSSSESIATLDSGGKGDVETYRILLLGALGVGKKALIREFIDPSTSYYPFQSLDDETDRSVSILLDGEESTLDFVDISDKEVDKLMSAEPIDAYVVVYSVEDRQSFRTAIDRLYEVRQGGELDVCLILVANKTDLVRTRVIHLDEGKSAAKTYGCKYIEVSAAIDHKIDELLVGILKQIRLIRYTQRKSRSKVKLACETNQTPCLLRARQNVLARIFKGTPKTKSCDNLYVL